MRANFKLAYAVCKRVKLNFSAHGRRRRLDQEAQRGGPPCRSLDTSTASSSQQACRAANAESEHATAAARSL
jgi:hypothetical protein